MFRAQYTYAPLANLSFIDPRTRYIDLSGVDLHDVFDASIRDFKSHFRSAIFVKFVGCNILSIPRSTPPRSKDFKAVHQFDLGKNFMTVIDRFTLLSDMPFLRILNFSGCEQLRRIEERALVSLEYLEQLDLSYTKIDLLPPLEFSWLKFLDLRHTAISKLRPSSFPNVLEVLGVDVPIQKCSAPMDAISSCTDLISDPFMRLLLWFVGMTALVGNIVTLIYRFIWERDVLAKPYGKFATSLSLADVQMGVYLMIIAWADISYRGDFAWSENKWRESDTCKFAGFLSILSGEASTIFVVLITLERFLVTKYPFGEYRISTLAAYLSSLGGWCTSFLIAAVPFFPGHEDWVLFSASSLCLAVPLDNGQHPGRIFSTVVYMGINFVMFVLLAGLLQILKGVDNMQGAYVWTAVLILPINSALNPLLYTLPSIKNKWKMHRKPKDMETESKDDTTEKSTSLDGILDSPEGIIRCLSRTASRVGSSDLNQQQVNALMDLWDSLGRTLEKASFQSTAENSEKRH
ncbi:G-protein coupled receptor GRL101-like [Aplysia californica]|uniref:G-protein coupled receptor GRL101-like n=1 Tax=Aplysia californica TaxID=6500 RepID=A0ABM1A247_APLCA|nr:G-protein coupled receptor GRL101-like [Aplysia californica]